MSLHIIIILQTLFQVISSDGISFGIRHTSIFDSFHVSVLLLSYNSMLSMFSSLGTPSIHIYTVHCTQSTKRCTFVHSMLEYGCQWIGIELEHTTMNLQLQKDIQHEYVPNCADIDSQKSFNIQHFVLYKRMHNNIDMNLKHVIAKCYHNFLKLNEVSENKSNNRKKIWSCLFRHTSANGVFGVGMSALCSHSAANTELSVIIQANMHVYESKQN